MRKTFGSIALLGVAAAVAGCGPGRHAAPDVRGKRLDVAQARLDAVGLRYDTVGGGTFGVVVRSHWFVCEQEPKPGKVTKTVRLIVARACPPPVVAARIVPTVTYARLDEAEEELERLGFRFEAYPTDGGSIVVPANWTVCEQVPAGGTAAVEVDLYVRHECFEDE
jgi:beta-lactam-binding protein with PASTA domain